MLKGSNLLAALREDELAVLAPSMTLCEYRTGKVLCEPGDIVEYCYFPRDGAIGSFLVPFDSSLAVETVMVGREGALGGIVSQGRLPSYARSMVMHGGEFYRIANRDLEQAKERSIAIRHLFTRYADCLMAQIFQSIACNAVHTIEQRAAKWLCAAAERTGSRDISMTQEQLASMMGIGRSYASRVIQRLKYDRLVKTRRGGIEVLDPAGLERRACECNDMVRAHFRAVMGGIYAD